MIGRHRRKSEPPNGELCQICLVSCRCERLALPPAIHVGLPETQRPDSHYPEKEALVMHLYVPGATAVDANVCEGEKIGF
jgi:hypothetical protein